MTPAFMVRDELQGFDDDHSMWKGVPRELTAINHADSLPSAENFERSASPGCTTTITGMSPSEDHQHLTISPGLLAHRQENPRVGRLQGTFEWSGQKQLEDGTLYVAGFDGRKEVWGRTAESWNRSSCHEKLKAPRCRGADGGLDHGHLGSSHGNLQHERHIVTYYCS